jgi:hypothetical protein
VTVWNADACSHGSATAHPTSAAAPGKLPRQCDGDAEADLNAGYNITEELHGNRTPVKVKKASAPKWESPVIAKTTVGAGRLGALVLS